MTGRPAITIDKCARLAIRSLGGAADYADAFLGENGDQLDGDVLAVPGGRPRADGYQLTSNTTYLGSHAVVR